MAESRNIVSILNSLHARLMRLETRPLDPEYDNPQEEDFLSENPEYGHSPDSDINPHIGFNFSQFFVELKKKLRDGDLKDSRYIYEQRDLLHGVFKGKRINGGTHARYYQMYLEITIIRPDQVRVQGYYMSSIWSEHAVDETIPIYNLINFINEISRKSILLHELEGLSQLRR